MSDKIHPWVAAMAKKLVADQEAAFMRQLSGITSTNVAAETPLTFEQLAETALKVRRDFGPVDRFLSSRLFPVDRSLQVANEKHRFTCAHPHFWMHVTDKIRSETVPTSPTQSFTSIYGMRIEQIDLTGEEDEGQRRYIQAIWQEMKAAFEVAMTPLPDWLASPRKPR